HTHTHTHTQHGAIRESFVFEKKTLSCIMKLLPIQHGISPISAHSWTYDLYNRASQTVSGSSIHTTPCVGLTCELIKSTVQRCSDAHTYTHTHTHTHPNWGGLTL